MLWARDYIVQLEANTIVQYDCTIKSGHETQKHQHNLWRYVNAATKLSNFDLKRKVFKNGENKIFPRYVLCIVRTENRSVNNKYLLQICSLSYGLYRQKTTKTEIRIHINFIFLIMDSFQSY